MSPATNSSSPVTTYVASASVVSTLISTEVVPASRSRTSPPTTSAPFTWKVAREVSVLAKTITFNVKLWVVSPSAAVTVTTSSFSPTARPESPVTSKVASWSARVTSTRTSSTPHTNVRTSPSNTAAPLTVTSAPASVLAGTVIMTV